jgi:hypothetical protein
VRAKTKSTNLNKLVLIGPLPKFTFDKYIELPFLFLYLTRSAFWKDFLCVFEEKMKPFFLAKSNPSRDAVALQCTVHNITDYWVECPDLSNACSFSRMSKVPSLMHACSRYVCCSIGNKNFLTSMACQPIYSLFWLDFLPFSFSFLFCIIKLDVFSILMTRILLHNYVIRHSNKSLNFLHNIAMFLVKLFGK